MTRMERALNIKGAFEVNRPELVAGKKYFIGGRCVYDRGNS